MARSSSVRASTTSSSGANIDYVKHLALALRELGVEDPHVEAVLRAL